MFGFGYNNGNIGIGTLQPQYNFDVSGNVNLTGDLYRDNLKIASLNSYLVKKVFIVSTMGMVFDLSYNGIIYLEQTEVEVFVNGYKLAYIDSINKDFDIVLEHDTNNNWTNFTVTLENNVLVGDVVDIIITPGLKFTTESPGLYQIGGLLGTIASPINGGTVNINISLVTNALIELSYGNNPLTINIIPSIFDTHIVGKRGRIYIRERSTNGRVLTIDNRIYFSSLYQPGGTSLASINPLIDILEYEVIKSDLIVGRYEKHTSAYSWDDVNKRLGIGISNPQFPLHVIGDTRIQGNLIVNGTQTMVDTNVNTTEMLDITNDGTGPALRVTQTGAQPIADFCDDLSTNVVLRIADGGNVGIGTTLPCKKLEVAGDISCNFLYGHVSWTDVSGSPMQEIPVGTVVVVDSSATILDETYIPVNGQTLNRVDYPELANSFNIPSGQATFTIPTTSQYQPDWHQSNATKPTYIKNKPNIVGDGNGNVIVSGNMGIGKSNPFTALDVSGNVTVTGNISANNMTLFRNRIINGDMRIDQRNVGYASGSNGLLTNNSGYGIDRWKVINTYGAGSVVQKQVTLSGPDAVSVGGNFINAVSITSTNQNGLIAHIPFDGSSPNDIFNSLVNPLSIGTGYSIDPVRIGSHCIDCTANTHSSSTPVRYVNYTLSPFFQNITTCSFTLWIYTTVIPVSGQACIFGLNTTAIAGPYLYLNTSSQLVWALYSSASASYTVTASSTIVINTWYHIVCTLEGGTAKIYINAGTPVSTAVSGFLTNGSYGILTGLTIGALTLSGGAFKGYIDDFRAYNRALTLGEINMLYSATDIQNINQWIAPTNPYINMPFDNSSVDLANTLTNIVPTGVSYSTSPVIVGTHSLNLTTNTANGGATAYITATTPSLILPLTVSCWIYASTVAAVQAILSFGGTEWGYIMNINASGQVYADAYVSGVNYNTPPSATSVIAANVWHHLCSVITPSGSHTLYLNGTPVGIRILGAATTLTDSTGGIVNVLNIGRQVNRASTTAYKGYIDDFRIFNRALTYREVAGLAVANPVMSFPFDGNLTDATGNGYTLTTIGSVQYVTGYVSNQALYLANETDVINATQATNYLTSSYNCPSTFSVSLWFCFTKGNSVGNTLFSTNSANTNVTNTINIYIANNVLYAAFHNTLNNGSGISVYPNQWYHVILTYNNGTLNLYVNGGKSGNTITGTYAVNGFMIGYIRASAQFYPFAGYIDDFCIYNKVLTATQIAQLYYSYTPNQCVLYQQPIEGYNIYDLGLGTSASQPMTASCWIKNNTNSAQTFSLSVNNSSLIAYMPFENSYIDVINTTLSQPVRYGNVTFSNSVNKVGTHSVYFNQTPNIAPTQYLSYTIPSNMQPQTVVFWFNPSTVNASSGQQFICHFGSTTNTVNDAWNLRIINNTQIYINLFITGYNVSSFFTAGYNTTLVAGTWYHCAVTFAPGGYLLLYFNGILVGSSQFSTVATVPLPSTFSLLNYTQGDAVNCFQIGGAGALSSSSYHGYIDDFRIYNRPLTAAQIYQLYINNASSTTVTDYLLARSYIYNTPTIAAETWQKIAFTIPAETIGYWTNDSNIGLILSLCLGSNSTYATAPNTWNSITEFTGTGVQILNDASTNFMSSNGNNIFITGVQLEKGNMVTPFEFRPLGLELQLCQRYYERLYTRLYSPTQSDNYGRVWWFFKVDKRIQISINEVTFNSGSTTGLSNDDSSISMLYLYKNASIIYISSGTFINAEL